MKMDHHCPWINNCCGHYNHANFVTFLLFAVVGAIHSSILLCIGLFRAYYAVINKLLRMNLFISYLILELVFPSQRSPFYCFPFDDRVIVLCI